MMLFGLNLTCVVGVSAGALSGLNYVAGQIGRSARINLGFRHDSRYVGAKAVAHAHSILDIGFLTEDRGVLEPFDWDRFSRPGQRFVAVATNCLSGEAEYFEKGACDDIMLAVRASATMPYISPMVDIGGVPYLDGGCACKIPYEWAIEQGFEKIVVLKTRELPFRKNPKTASAAHAAYRGTDNSLAGWKEDFNLTFMDEVPSQASARSYLEDTAAAVDVPLIVGGHSKGGNLAEYAALACRAQTFERIARIFNHDGPGFAFEPSERINASAYRDKLEKTVPGSSVFGMLMEDRGCYRVVKSSGVLFVQHATTHWVVEGDGFVTLGGISPEASIISGTLNRWSQSYGPDEREAFIDAVYGIVRAADATTLADFWSNKPENILAVTGAMAQLSPEMRSTLFGMVRDIAPILGSEAASSLGVSRQR